MKTRSPPASQSFNGQVTEQTTVKWSIERIDTLLTQSVMKEGVGAWVDMCEALLVGQKIELLNVEIFDTKVTTGHIVPVAYASAAKI